MSEQELEKILNRDGYTVQREFRSGGFPTADTTEQTDRKGKHNAIPTERDGIRFDSKTEACRYDTLKLQEQLGLISELGTHPKFELQPAFTHKATGARYQAITHKADFRYVVGGKVIVEDWKGRGKDGKPYMTDEYKRTRKLLLYRYPDMNHFVNCDMHKVFGE